MKEKTRSALLATGVAICAVASVFIRSSVASEPDAMTQMLPSAYTTPLNYMRLYSDDEGISHFAHETFALQPGSDKTQGPLPSLPIPNVQGATYVALKGGGAENGIPRRAGSSSSASPARRNSSRAPAKCAG